MAKKAKKRGVKPGTKRGSYKRKPNKIIRGLKEALALSKLKDGPWKVSENHVGPGLVDSYTPAPTLTLCGQLEDAILLLETRISNSIAKINSLM